MTLNLDELYGIDDAGSEDQDFLVGGAEREQLAAPTWFGGSDKNPEIVNGKPRKEHGFPVFARGFHFGINGMPERALKAFERLEEKKIVRKVNVQHAPSEDNPQGNVKEYYTYVKDPIFHLLTHGAPKPYAIQKDARQQVGLAAGLKVTFNEKKGTTTKLSFVSVLTVERHLYDAGYVDDDGNPLLIPLNFSSIDSQEFYKALNSHYEYILALRQQQGVSKRKATYWAQGLCLRVSEDTVVHGKGQESANVFIVENAYADKSLWSPELEKELYCGDELFLQLFMLVHDTTVKPVVPGGFAVEWCKETVAYWNGERKRLGDTDDKDSDIKMGSNKPAPQRLINRRALNDASVYNPNAIVNRAVREEPQEQDEGSALRQTLSRQKRSLDVMAASFEKAKNDQALTMLDEVYDIHQDAIGAVENKEYNAAAKNIELIARKINVLKTEITPF